MIGLGPSHQPGGAGLQVATVCADALYPREWLPPQVLVRTATQQAVRSADIRENPRFVELNDGGPSNDAGSGRTRGSRGLDETRIEPEQARRCVSLPAPHAGSWRPAAQRADETG